MMEKTSDVTTTVCDADGNQTRVQTSTGIWAVSYDTENRPTDFTCTAADNTITTVHCEYDSMGRRSTKMVMVNGNVTLQQRYIYRGYLQIASIDLTRSHHPALWYITWDPTQPIATRPLAIQKDATWYTYGWDLTKNICEVFGPAGYLRTAYTYTPYGEATSEGDVTQPIQWSSEYCDTELGLVYYNYRHYTPVDGRWIARDLLSSQIAVLQEYGYTSIPCSRWDLLGLLIGQGQPNTNPQALDVIPNMNPSCNKCNQWISHMRSVVRTMFTPQELDEGHCRYRFKCLTCNEFSNKYGIKVTAEQRYDGMTSPSYRRYPKKRSLFPDIKKLVYINIDIPCNVMSIGNLVHEMQHAVDLCSLNSKAYNGNGYTESTLYKETRAYSKAQVRFTNEEILYIKNAENTDQLRKIDKLHLLFNRVFPSFTYSMKHYSKNNIEKNDLKNYYFELLQKGEIMVLPYAL